MAQHRSLGHTRGAAGVLQEGDVVVIQCDRLQRMRGAACQRVAETHGLRQVERRNHLLDVLEHEVDQHAFRAQQVANAGGDDVLHVGFRDDLLQRRGEVVQHHDGLGAGVLQLMLEFACGIHRVRVDHDQARAQRAEQRDRILQHVRHHDRDAIALAEHEFAGEVAGELTAHFVDLAIGQPMAEIRESGPFAKLLERFLEHGRYRGIGIDVNLAGHACWIVIQPRTFDAHAWVPCVDDRGWTSHDDGIHHGSYADSFEHTPAYSGKPHRNEFRP